LTSINTNDWAADGASVRAAVGAGGQAIRSSSPHRQCQRRCRICHLCWSSHCATNASATLPKSGMVEVAVAGSGWRSPLSFNIRSPSIQHPFTILNPAVQQHF
jgi:hypothetical protein